jgi:uncharacterized protein YndB with AHSA1/START domain
MGRRTQVRDISAPPDRVFSGYTDPVLIADWMRLSDVREATGPLDRPGTRYVMVVRGPWRFRIEVLAADPPRMLEYRGRGPLGASVHVTARLTPTAAGTHLEETTEYGLPFGPFGRWLDRRFVEPQVGTPGDREIDRLVELVSTPAH